MTAGIVMCTTMYHVAWLCNNNNKTTTEVLIGLEETVKASELLLCLKRYTEYWLRLITESTNMMPDGRF